MRGLRRIYFLLPDLDLTHKIVDELLLAHVPYNHIHILARPGTPLADLPEANILQSSDLVPAMERGLAYGGSAGLIAGLVALAIPAGPVVAGGAVLFSALGWAGFGAWVAGMIGVSLPNSRLERFEKAIEAGEILMMADVPKLEVEEFEELVRSHHPEVDIEGTEPTIPAFP
jgi:hypothetical protein